MKLELYTSSKPEEEKNINFSRIHPGRLTWNLQITHLERKMIFQTPMIMFHVNLPGWYSFFLFNEKNMSRTCQGEKLFPYPTQPVL